MHVTDLCPSHELLLVICGLLLQVTQHAISSQQSRQSCIGMGIVCTGILACKPKTAVKHCRIQMLNMLEPTIVVLICRHRWSSCN